MDLDKTYDSMLAEFKKSKASKIIDKFPKRNTKMARVLAYFYLNEGKVVNKKDLDIMFIGDTQEARYLAKQRQFIPGSIYHLHLKRFLK